MDNYFSRIINTLKAGPERFNREYGRIYDEMRPCIISALRSKYPFLTVEIVEEAFQDAMHKLYVDVKTGKIDNSDMSIKAYLFIRGRNKALDQNRRLHSDREVETPVEELDLFRNLSYESNEVEDAEKKTIVFRLVHSIGEPCSKVLTYFFYDVLPMREIATAMGYKNSDVAKVTKKKCLEKVKAVAKCNFEIKNLI